MTTKQTKPARTAASRVKRRPTVKKVARAGSTPPVAGDTPSKPMLIGYARVSTVDQNLALQRDALTEAGCEKIFTEQLSGDRQVLRQRTDERTGQGPIHIRILQRRPGSRRAASQRSRQAGTGPERIERCRR